MAHLGNSPRQDFPLSLLFLLMALFAIPLAMLGAMAADFEPSSGSSASQGAGAAAVFFMISITGVVIGVHHYRRFSGMVLGGLIGMVFGALTCPLVAARAQTTPRLLAMSAAGAAVLVILSYTLRTLSKTPGEQDPAAHPLDDPTRSDDFL